MALYNPPPPLLTTATTDTTAFNNGGAATASSNIILPQNQHHSSSSPSPSSSSFSSSTSTTTSIIIVVIVIASAIIISASIYLLLKFFSRRCSRLRRSFSPADDVVTVTERNGNEGQGQGQHHVICFDGSKAESLPSFTFSSLTGDIPGGDCAICLSKFKAVDQLRLLPLCCHAFHSECIDAWLKSNQTCPICRSTVNYVETDELSKILSVSERTGGADSRNRNNSFRIEIGSVSRRRTPYDSGRRSYSIGSYDYILDDGYEVPIESTHRREISVDKDSTTPAPPGESLTSEIGHDGGSGRLNWLRDYVDRVSVSISSRSQSFRGSGRFFTGSSRRSEAVDDFDAAHGRVGEEISELWLFRWLSGV